MCCWGDLMAGRDGIEWPATDITLKQKFLLIWRVVKACFMNTVKTNDWLEIYEILMDGCSRDIAATKEKMLEHRFSGKE